MSFNASSGLKLPRRFVDTSVRTMPLRDSLADEDETCLPPPLSAYSMAVLQDRVSPLGKLPPHTSDREFQVGYLRPIRFTKAPMHRSSANTTNLSFGYPPVTPSTEVIHTTEHPQRLLTPRDERNESLTQASCSLQPTVRARNARRVTRIGLGPPKRVLRALEEPSAKPPSPKETAYYEYLERRLETAQRDSFSNPTLLPLSQELDRIQQAREDALRNEKLSLERSRLELRKKQLMEERSLADLADKVYRDTLLDARLRNAEGARGAGEVEEGAIQMEEKSGRGTAAVSLSGSRPMSLAEKARVNPVWEKLSISKKLKLEGEGVGSNRFGHQQSVPEPIPFAQPLNDSSARPPLMPVPYNARTPPSRSAKRPVLEVRVLADPPVEKPKKQLFDINETQFEKLELIGRGGSSKVYKAKSLRNNRIYAIKKVIFDQFDDASVHGFKGEIALLLQLREATNRVVKLIDYSMTEGSLYLVMECGEIDLAHVLSERIKQPMDVAFVRYHALEVLRCVASVHAAGIVHSDLKPANFLFVRGTLKLIDFGISNAVPEHTVNIYRESQIGTPNYMAPEALVESKGFGGYNNTDDTDDNQAPGATGGNTWKVGKPSDIWSCGCILYQMIYGRPPYGSYAGHERLMAIMNPQVQISYPTTGLGDIPVPQAAISALKQCLERDPTARPTASEVLATPFLSPKVVSDAFVKDLVRSAVDYGYNNPINDEVYGRLVATVMQKIRDLNY